jgi:hypothetical protein
MSIVRIVGIGGVMSIVRIVGIPNIHHPHPQHHRYTIHPTLPHHDIDGILTPASHLHIITPHTTLLRTATRPLPRGTVSPSRARACSRASIVCP